MSGHVGRWSLLWIGLGLAMACRAERPVAIGVALSGVFVDAARLALAEDTARASLPPLDTLFFAEATSRAAPALDLADRFVRTPGMVAVVAHSNSASSLAAAPLYNQEQVVQIAPTTTAASYSEAGPYSFRMVPPDTAQAAVLIQALDSLYPAGASVALLYVNDDYGRSLRRGFLARLERGDHAVVLDQPHSDLEVDLTADDLASRSDALLSSLEAAEPDVIVWLGRARTLARQLTPLRERLGAIPILGSDALSSWATFDRGDGAWDGVRYADFLDPATPALAEFQARYTARFGARASTGEILSYDAMQLVLAAVRDGARTGEEAREWLVALGRDRPAFAGVSGALAFTEAGDIQRPYALLTIHAATR